MAIPILNHLDLRSAAELQNAILHKTTSASASNVEGKIIYDTGSNAIKFYDGSQWVELSGTGATYDLTVPTDTTSIRLAGVTGSGNTNDDVALSAGDNISLSRVSATEIRITATDTNTTTTADVLSALNADFGGDATFGTQSDDVVTFTGGLTVGGDLTVNGTTTTVNSTTVTIDDPVFTLGGDTAPASDDNKDRGIEFRYHDGTAARLGFFGYDDSASEFTFLTGATNSSEVFSGDKGNINVAVAKMTTLNIGGTAVTSTAAELNILDGVTATTSEINILDGVTATTTEINILDGVTSTTTELNILDGVTATTTELNVLDGDSEVEVNTVVNGDGFIHNDGGTMKVTTVASLASLFAGTNITATNSVLSVADSSASTKGVVIVSAGDGIDVSYSSGTATVSAETANATNPGVVELATSAETRTGTDSTRAVTPSGLQARHSSATFPESTEASGFTQTVAHGMGTYVHVTVIQTSDGTVVFPEVAMTSANSGTVTMTFASGASAGAYRYMISLVD